MTPPRSRTLGELLAEQAEHYGAHPAVIAAGRTVGYAELNTRAEQIAGWFSRQGVRRGDRIGLLMNNRTEWLEVFFGAAMLGAVVVACSTWSRRDELDYVLADSRIRFLVTIDEFAGQGFVSILRELAPEADMAGPWTSARYPALQGIVLLGPEASAGWTNYAELFAKGATPRPSLAPGDGASAADDAIVIYTSGSSSRPKSVPLAHYGVIENGFNIGERQGYTSQDRVLLAPPLFWSYGSANAMSAVLTHGATLVLQSRFEAREALDLIEQHRCTALYTLPNITSALVNHPLFRPERTASLRTGLTIGAPQDVRLAAETLGARDICNIYGQTESYGNCCVTWHHWPLQQRMECQGPPLPGVTLRIVDSETGELLPTGAAGQIEVRGYLSRGYIDGSVKQNADAWTEDGFFRTGDMGSLGVDGALCFLGRTAEMIKKDGINVSPAEVEDILMRHPAVLQAGVVGVPHARRGELIAAFVILQPSSAVTVADLLGYCRTVASRYKAPDFVEFRECLPATVTGKLLRRELKGEAANLRVED
jgi:fatty-acyl-CoA synthase